MSPALEAFFLPAAPGRRLCLHHIPDGQVRAVTLHVHAWAEEMNKSRRMVAATARALADAGVAVLLMDLHGCGDSTGELEDATWSGWLEDVALGLRWLRDRYPTAPLWLWGHRAGALLAAQAAAKTQNLTGLMLWQAQVSGKAVLQNFLRLKAAAGLQAAPAKQVLDRLRADLAAGRAVDVAGYRLGNQLAVGLEQATLEPTVVPIHLVWLETSTREAATLLPASAVLLERWRAAGHQVRAHTLAGPSFWQTQEIVDAPLLTAATVSSVLETLTAADSVPA